ncbi:DinB family protein [Paenibacillus lautus]|uniref:DinB family protein n=1 Tax=Paenibacillus lautus TaxID=1401 RepID=UPI003D27B187
MRAYLFEHLEFVRTQTLNLVRNAPDDIAEMIPSGMNNHVKWNVGHVLFTMERFAFGVNGETINLPEHYTELFRTGSKPREMSAPWPSMAELIELLEGQVQRIEDRYTTHLHDTVSSPYTTSKGLKLTRVEEFLSFCLYHEGMHFDKMKSILSQNIQKFDIS